MTARHTDDRVTYNDPDNWTGADYAIGAVDEVVVHDALVHFEMSSDTSAYLTARSRTRDVFLHIRVRPSTRGERRQILVSSRGTLRDHVAALIPRWLGGRSYWSIPWWQRPAAAVCGWWADRRAASAVLTADCEQDDILAEQAATAPTTEDRK